MKKLVISTVFVLLFADFADAQSFYSRRRDRSWMLSFGIGVSTYHGDLHDVLYDGLGSARGFNVGGGLRKKIGSQISVRLDLNYYSIGGDDADSGFLRGKDPSQRNGPREGLNDTRFKRNLSFEANNIEASFLLTFNLIPVKGSYTRRPILNPYLMLGIGITSNNPTTTHPNTGEKINLRHLNTEALPGQGYSGSLLVIPVGIGIRFKANQYVDILFEAARRFTFSDYLDDVSTVYPSEDALRKADRIGDIEDALVLYTRSGENPDFGTREAGGVRGNPDLNDAYYIFQVRLELYLPDNFVKKLFAPSRRKPKFR